ncbi:hypothetical protein Lal_00016911 [Lupinus albus]|nr:hypothetical protein Lal_00016911 [Lupinus albus]
MVLARETSWCFSISCCWLLTSRQLCLEIIDLCQAQTKAHGRKLGSQLCSITKGSSSISEYFTQIKMLFLGILLLHPSPLHSSESISSGKPFDSLSSAVHSSSFHTRPDAIREQFHGSGGFRGGSCGARGGGGCFASKNSYFCTFMWCNRFGHDVTFCYYAPSNFGAPYSQLYGTPPNAVWYPDSGAIHHLTSDSALVQEPCKKFSADKIYMGNAAGNFIQAYGSSKFQSLTSPNTNLSLNTLFLVPSITKKLPSVSQFSTDNLCYFEYILIIVLQLPSEGKLAKYNQDLVLIYLLVLNVIVYAHELKKAPQRT